MKYLTIILLALFILNACVLCLLLAGTFIKRLNGVIKGKASDSEKVWEPPLTTPEHRRSGATGSLQER